MREVCQSQTTWRVGLRLRAELTAGGEAKIYRELTKARHVDTHPVRIMLHQTPF